MIEAIEDKKVLEEAIAWLRENSTGTYTQEQNSTDKGKEKD
jgi:hypothetical protein